MSILKESKSIVLISIPLIIGQLGQMLLGLADSLMVAKLGVTELAALTLANNLSFLPLVFGMGIMSCVTVRTATARGAGDKADARSVCRNSTYLSLIIGIAMAVFACLSSGVLQHLGQDPEVAHRALHYYFIIMVSMIPAMLGISLKNHADALNFIWTAFWISIGGVGLNIFLNWIFIFGKCGLPAMQLEGAGVATLISRVAIVVAMLLWFNKSRKLREWTPFHWFKKWDFTEIKALVRLGLPSGLQTCSEVGAFVTAGILIGWFGKEALAAHQIAMVCTTTAFMIPLGMSIALTMVVSESVGKKETGRLKSIYLSGWTLSLIFSIFSAATFLIFGEALAGEFIENEPDVVSLAASLLVVAGIFQLVDGQQICSVSMLRGLKDTTSPAIIAFISYWVIGIPFGYWMAFHQGVGPVGVWWGLALGLAVASVPLAIRLWRHKLSRGHTTSRNKRD